MIIFHSVKYVAKEVKKVETFHLQLSSIIMHFYN